MRRIDITGKKVTVTKGGLELRTATQGTSGWPYKPWMLRPNPDDGKPGMVFLKSEKGEILSETPDAEYKIEDI